MEFLYNQPTKIIFGKDKLNDVGEIMKTYGNRCLIVMQTEFEVFENLYKKICDLLDEKGIETCIFNQIRPNPTQKDIEEGVKVAHQFKATSVLAVGGGSVIDTAKIIAYCCDEDTVNWKFMYDDGFKFLSQSYNKENVLPLVSISTTSGTGSNVTQASVVSDVNNKKTTIFRQEFLSKVTIIDPSLMLSLPNYLTATCAWDVFSHLCESYYNGKYGPLCEMMAEEGIRMVGEHLPQVLIKNDLMHREKLALADLYAGICLSNGGGNVPHYYGEMISSCAYSINHGASLAITFPLFIKHFYNDRLRKMIEILVGKNKLESGKDAMDAVVDFLNKIGLKTRLEEYDLSQEQKEAIYEEVTNQKRFEMDDKQKSFIKDLIG